MLSASAPFEGPEKLLEVWFAPSPAHVPDVHSPKNGKIGLRNVPRIVWEEMLAIVKCKVLSVIEGDETDAYLLSESSLFVFAHRIILKTCGTTLNLLGLPGILDIARDYASLPSVYQCFYSRKSFMFPERQLGPHREWKDEVAFLDAIFPTGAAYTVGKVNGDHWLLYITSPGEAIPPDVSEVPTIPDYTIEILMSDLSPEARQPFCSSTPSPGDDVSSDQLPSILGQTLSSSLRITEIFPARLTTLDAYAFSPCGYSSNALLKWGNPRLGGYSGEGYYTIHVTPEEGWSYASFECNVPLSPSSLPSKNDMPDLETLVRRVVDIFQPGRLSMTLFISSEHNNNTEEDGDTAIEAAQRAFKVALSAPRPESCSSSGSGVDGERPKAYRRTDKINYEFGGYDLAFASFELR
ncbi:S-adenosylmethionine decarboxylase [Scleroderma citrinum]